MDPRTACCVFLTLCVAAAHALQVPKQVSLHEGEKYTIPATPGAGATHSAPNVHVAFLSGCSHAHAWRSMGLTHSHAASWGQQGNLTCLINGSEGTKDGGSGSGVDGSCCAGAAGVFTAPAPTRRYRQGAQQCPLAHAVVQWLHQQPSLQEDWVLLVDEDVLFRKPVDPIHLGVRPGVAASSAYGLFSAPWGTPGSMPAGGSAKTPKGLDSTQLSAWEGLMGFVLIHQFDLYRLSMSWLQLCQAMSETPEEWSENLGVDLSTLPAPAVQALAYSLAAERAGVKHVDASSNILHLGLNGKNGRQGHAPHDPAMLHYHAAWEIPGVHIKFDPQAYTSFDPRRCPPWGLAPYRVSQGGLLPHPPGASWVLSQDVGNSEYALLSTEPILLLNAALCQRHGKHCEASGELQWECGTVQRLRKEFDSAWAGMTTRTAPEQLAVQHQRQAGGKAELADHLPVVPPAKRGVGSNRLDGERGAAAVWPQGGPSLSLPCDTFPWTRRLRPQVLGLPGVAPPWTLFMPAAAAATLTSREPGPGQAATVQVPVFVTASLHQRVARHGWWGRNRTSSHSLKTFITAGGGLPAPAVVSLLGTKQSSAASSGAAGEHLAHALGSGALRGGAAVIRTEKAVQLGQPDSLFAIRAGVVSTQRQLYLPGKAGMPAQVHTVRKLEVYIVLSGLALLAVVGALALMVMQLVH